MQARHLGLIGRVILHLGGWCAGSRAEQKTEAGIETNLVDQLHGCFEIRFGFAREANDEIRRDRDIRPNRSQFAHDGFVFERGISAFHRRQNPI